MPSAKNSKVGRIDIANGNVRARTFAYVYACNHRYVCACVFVCVCVCMCKCKKFFCRYAGGTIPSELHALSKLSTLWLEKNLLGRYSVEEECEMVCV